MVLIFRQLAISIFLFFFIQSTLSAQYTGKIFVDKNQSGAYDEEGNTLFVITPMMGGDYKPGFTREEIGTWMKNLVSAYPKEQPKYFFNHDLLSQSKDFTIESTPLVMDDSIIFGAMDGYLYSLNKETGHIEQKVFLGAPILGNASKTNDGFVVTGFAGNVYRFEWQ